MFACALRGAEGHKGRSMNITLIKIVTALLSPDLHAFFIFMVSHGLIIESNMVI